MTESASWHDETLDALPLGERVDIGFPADPVAFYRQHGFTGVKGWLDPAEAQQLVSDIAYLRSALVASTPASAPYLALLPWSVSKLPAVIIQRLRLRHLADLAEQLLGAPARVLTWQVFARGPGETATSQHADGDYVPLDTTTVAFWIPLMPTPERTGLVTVANVDGSGMRPVRQVDIDPGDLRAHNSDVIHWAEDMPVDTLAFGLAVYPDGARIDLGTAQPANIARTIITRRIFGDLRTGDLAVGPANPLLSDLPG